ncbi:TPA: TIGR02594 family protein [Escherichia coli]|uniref:TIGR02594 family protein n=1 Tax=Escherichia coli TaxID=562 RepID=UPI0007E3971D|nr:TIGR02594 family protein [Escherichia coli]EFG2177021.1 TIGR02594 family protein [Escherichia coli]EFK1930367.1 TIGR02594 family protein [Escherichia coli]EFL5791207.1 TIGR02594 family protein [Escherichia coli]EFM8838281.1 TIGR02594 family protein [Escherichia coli]EIO6565372.1 TIGR02594 family protein [Escherichia coli]
MSEPAWVIEARKYIGERELKGPKHNSLILQMWRDIKRGGIKDDETPWCAAFVGAVLERCGIKSTRFESAGSYLGWGEQLLKPAFGCVVVFKRDSGGHVGFVVGQNSAGDLLVLGGNQSDAVNIKAFPRSRVSGYRCPAGVQDIPDFNLPEQVNISFSISEA